VESYDKNNINTVDLDYSNNWPPVLG